MGPAIKLRQPVSSRNRVVISEFSPHDVVAGHLRPGARPRWRLPVGCNLLLDEGNALVCALISDVDTDVVATKLNEANAYIGVGDGVTAPAADQEGLIGPNKLYKGMDTDYPTWDTNSASLVYRSLFIDTEAEFVWAEATLANGNSDAAENLGRLLFDVAIEKTAGKIWACDYYVRFI